MKIRIPTVNWLGNKHLSAWLVLVLCPTTEATGNGRIFKASAGKAAASTEFHCWARLAIAWLTGWPMYSSGHVSFVQNFFSQFLCAAMVGLSPYHVALAFAPNFWRVWKSLTSHSLATWINVGGSTTLLRSALYSFIKPSTDLTSDCGHWSSRLFCTTDLTTGISQPSDIFTPQHQRHNSCKTARPSIAITC